jgi:integrase
LIWRGDDSANVKAFRTIKNSAQDQEKTVRPIVLYSLRHTFLTRLGESGCNVWTLARIAGHSSIAMSARYVHPSEDSVVNAMGLIDVERHEQLARPS